MNVLPYWCCAAWLLALSGGHHKRCLATDEAQWGRPWIHLGMPSIHPTIHPKRQGLYFELSFVVSHVVSSRLCCRRSFR